MHLCDLGKRFAPLAGRILLSLIFIIAGFSKIGGFDNTAAYMASKGLPLPQVLLVLTIIIELGGGLLLLLGWQARWAALAIFLFIIPTTLIFHNFWAYEGMDMVNQRIQFMKNLAMMGGMAYVIAFGPGRYSLGKDNC